jgi:phospholipid/cholesterol/gamma-HCH transport system substrate-binding protein
METRANYVLIGAFVLLAAAALMLFTLWIAGTPLNRSYSTYDVVFEGPVNGLTEGGEVRFNGIKVGEVRRLSLDRQDPNRVIARIQVDSQTPVRTDSVAQLNFLGITGVTFIQILAGKPDQPLLKSEDFRAPPVIRTERTALDELFQGGQDLLTVTGDAINRVNAALSEENVEHVTAILVNVRKVSDKLARDGGVIDSMQSALNSLDKAAISIQTTSNSVNAAVENVDEDVAQLVADASEAVKNLRPAVEDARRAMEGVNKAVAQINRDVTPAAGRTLDQLASTAGDLSGLMIRLQGVLGEIEQDPSRFVYRQPHPVEQGAGR